MATNPNSMVQEAVDATISKRCEIGLQVVAYMDGKQVVDVWGGLAEAGRCRHTLSGVLRHQGGDGSGVAHPGGARAGGLRYAHRPLLA